MDGEVESMLNQCLKHNMVELLNIISQLAPLQQRQNMAHHEEVKKYFQISLRHGTNFKIL